MPRPGVVVLGGSNVDYLCRGETLPKPGDTKVGTDFQEAPGGKGANQAIAAARLGASVTLVTRIGVDGRGDCVLRRLDTEHVDTRYVVRDRSAATGVALIQVGARGEKQILTAPGANLRASTDDVRAAATAIRHARVLLAQLELPLGTVTEAVNIAHDAGVRVVLDPAPPVKVADALLRAVSVIRPNSNEAEALTGITVRDQQSARKAGVVLLDRGAGAAVVQAGDDGNLMVWRDDGGTVRECWFPVIAVRSIDATGAGDAFAAALAVILAEGKPLPVAGRFGNAGAALATTKLGAQAGLPARADVISLLEQTGVHDAKQIYSEPPGESDKSDREE
jgi:ribokinase